MQLRLGTRRLELAAWSIGMAQRALDIMVDHATQRTTFGQKLSERGVVQGWIADAATRIHAARLMAYNAAWKVDEGRDVRMEISMVKAFATEMAGGSRSCDAVPGRHRHDARGAATPDGGQAQDHAHP